MQYISPAVERLDTLRSDCFKWLFCQAGRAESHSGEMHADERASPREAEAVREPGRMGELDEVGRTLLLYRTVW